MLILLIPLLTGCLNLESLCHLFKVPFVTAHLIITYMYSSYSETRGADLLNVFHITLFYMLETLPIKFFFKYFLNKRCHLESGHSFPKRSLEGNIWGKVQRNRFVYEESPEKMLT